MTKGDMMFFYIKIRKKGSSLWTDFKENGKILVFETYIQAKRRVVNVSPTLWQIVMAKEDPNLTRNGKKPIRNISTPLNEE